MHKMSDQIKSGNALRLCLHIDASLFLVLQFFGGLCSSIVLKES